MLLHLAPLAARKILNAASSSFERVMNYQLKIGVRRLGWRVTRNRGFSIHGRPVDHNRLAFDDNFLSRQIQVDANVEGFALLVMAVRNLNRHAASDDAVVEGFEFFGF